MAVEMLREQGYQVEHHAKALPEAELIEKIQDVQAIGIRSKTKLTSKVLAHAKKLLVIGCFCIGTNQVDLEYAARHGVAVFNSPFSNSRSVAELVIAEIISLARELGDRNTEMHQGVWNKVSAGCWEIRGKTLGIVGYGHIGTQLSVLAESFGMRVLYYDVLPIMPLGNTRQVATLDELLSLSDFVTLHVPELEDTKNMIGEAQLAQMKKGSYLINASRGSIVQIPALVKAMKSGHIKGAALDVYPREPGSNGPTFDTELNSWAKDLASCNNIILTPHIGGSTEEAQLMIGQEVATALTKYVNFGGSYGAVNFPEVELRAIEQDHKHIRVLYVHQNVPGVLKVINDIISPFNVEKQYSDSRGSIAYLMADISNVSEAEIKEINDKVSATPANVMTRVLY